MTAFTILALLIPAPALTPPLSAHKPGQDVVSDVGESVPAHREEGAPAAPIVTPVMGFGGNTPQAPQALPLASAQSFPHAQLPALDNSQEVVGGDLDQDGKTDLVLARFQGIEIFYGAGDGTFSAPVPITNGFSGYAVELADLDGDSDLDIVYVNGGQQVFVIANLGGGAFAAPVTYTTGNVSDAFAIADFTSDGLLDIAVTRRFSNAVVLLIGTGATGFAGPTPPIATASSPLDVKAGDLNGDGTQDLIVSCHNANQATVLLNDGFGTFGRADYPAGTRPERGELGDVDGDGDLDYVFAEEVPNAVGVLYNDGNGAMSHTSFGLAMGDEPWEVELSDVDGDGDLDAIACLNGATNGRVGVSVLENLGGTFGNEVHVPCGVDEGWIALTDIDNDGDEDLVRSNERRRNVSLVENCGGVFDIGRTILSGGTQLDAGDFNGDGYPDLVRAENGDVTVFLNDGTGALLAGSTQPVSTGLTRVVAIDMDGDLDLDALLNGPSPNTATVLLNDGSGNLAAPIDYPAGQFPESVAAGDLDGDGDADVVVTNGFASSVSVLFNTGAGALSAPTPLTLPIDANRILVGDLDGDLDVDIVAGSQVGSQVHVFFNLGGGTFAPAVSFPSGVRQKALDLLDVDLDGDPDLLCAGDQSLVVFENDGAGGFPGSTSFPADLGPIDLVKADVDGDGILDVLVACEDAGNVNVFHGDGVGGFRPLERYGFGTLPAGVAAADFDRDGDVDVVGVTLRDMRILDGLRVP